MTEKMKDSGIEWIGEIPEEWEIKIIKNIANLKGRIGWQGLTSDEYIDEGPYLITGVDFENGNVNWDSCEHVSVWRYQQAPEIQIKDNDLLITKDGTVGKIALIKNSPEQVTLNSGVLLIRPLKKDYREKFLYYVLLSEEFWHWFEVVNIGNTTITHLYQNIFAKFKLTLPPIGEQQDIADFLDKKVGQVDDILADLNKQVEILNQYKKSLITETVTKGLNPNAEMKDSGIDWIGEIPKEWEIKPLKYLTSLIIDGTHNTPTYVDEGIPFLRVTDITSTDGIDRPIDLNTVARISQEEHNFLIKRCNPQKGDILVSKNGTIGVPKVIDWEWNFSIFVSLCLIKVKNELLNKFLFYYFKSELVNTEIAFGGKTNTITNLHLEKIANFRIPVPPIQEQEAIVDYLDKKCTQIDDLITDKQKQIEKMENYKKSLIYEYVTGKKRVGV